MAISDAYKYPPLHNPRTQDVFQSIVKGRKSWKTLRGGEIVWPPELEAALLEGLEAYQPDDSRETRLLGRFPMRNRFISEYIMHKTGKRRTAKQVGSRLQQLRDTCGGKRLLYLLSPRRPTGSASTDAHLNFQDSLQSDTDSSSDSSSLPPTPTEPSTDFSKKPSRTVIHIDLLPEDASYLDSSSVDPHPSPVFENCPSPVYDDVVRVSPHPRPLRSIDPTVTFLADSPISAKSTFTVMSCGMTVFSETIPLVPAGPAPNATDNALLYSTTMVPGFWQTIAKSPDPTQYTIVQEVVKDGPSSPITMFSAVYKFTYRSKEPEWLHSPALSSALSDQSSASDETNAPCIIQPSVPFDTLLPMEPTPYTEYDDLDTYFDFNSVDVKPNWELHSSSEFSSDMSSGYEQFQSCGADQLHVFDRLSVPHLEGSFPTDLYDY